MSKAERKQATPKTLTLVEFMRKKTKDACLVCALPVQIRTQIGAAASKKGYSRGDQLEWLRSVCGFTKITMEHLLAHLNGRHDTEEDLHG